MRKTRASTTRTGVVTAIEPLANDPTRRRILVEGKPAATLIDHQVSTLGIDVGTRWTATLARRVDDAVTLTKAHTRALAMLGRRACTHGEIVAGLEKASFDSAVARRVADELVAQGWIDESQIAAHAARSLSQRHIVHEAIAEKLRARHVPEELAEEATAEALANVDHVERARRHIKQKLASKRGAPSERDIRRILGSLSRKGFDADDVNAAFRELGIDLGAIVDGWDA